MQIGQILVERRWVEPDALLRALADQVEVGMRICSLLIARGELDPDNAARALATQHNVPGVLQKHLENREPGLVGLLPAAIARACVALPIGRTRNQELIVCVRDPRPELRGVLSSAVGGPVMIAVAPARQLEQLIALAYDGAPGPPAADDEGVDVDLSTRQIATVLDDAEIARYARDLQRGPGAGDAAARRSASDDPLDGLGTMTLVGLDDVRVAKDPTQSGQFAAVMPRTTTMPLPPRTMTTPARDASTPPFSAHGPTLDATLAAMDHASTPDDAIDDAMRYLAGRFRHAVLFTINEGAALGDRGHGGALTPEIIQAITVPLSAPSIVQAAHRTRRLATVVPRDAGAIQDRLARALGHPQGFAAVPIEVDTRVAYVIVVGDAGRDPDSAPDDLEQVGGALAAALARAPAR